MGRRMRTGSHTPESTVTVAMTTRFGGSPGRATWFLRKAAASSLEHLVVCQVVPFGNAIWFATTRTPPLWQRGFFLVNCLVLRRLLASMRSGVLKTFRCQTPVYGIATTQRR